MEIKSARLGTMDIDEKDVITFPEGLVGFSRYKKYVMLPISGVDIFRMLHSIELEKLSFVVCNPVVFKPDYSIQIAKSELETIEIDDIGRAEVWTILNRLHDPYEMTANLKGPIILNRSTMLAKQLILADDRYPAKYKLFSRPSSAAPVQEES